MNNEKEITFVVDDKYGLQQNDEKTLASDIKILEVNNNIYSEGYFEKASFLLFGIVTLFSWTAIITQLPYFQSRVRESIRHTVGPTLGVISMGSLMCGSILNIVVLYKYKSKIKIILTLISNLIGFFVIILIVRFDIDDILFLIILLIITLIMNTMQPILMSSFYEELRCYSSTCYTTYNLGIGSSSLITGLLLVVITPFDLSSKNSALVFVVIAFIVIFLCLIIYIGIIKSKLYKKSFDNLSNKCQDLRSSMDKFRAMMKMFMHIWKDAISIILCFTVTLFIFPVLLLSVQSVSLNESWLKYFHKIYVFFLYGFGDTVGRYINKICSRPKPGNISIVLFALSRFLFIILFLFCNRPGKKTQNIAFLMSDFFPCIINLCLALSHTLIVSIILSIPYTLEKDEDKVDCSRTLVLCISSGLTTGAMLSFIVPYF